jgi:hypothetical protein
MNEGSNAVQKNLQGSYSYHYSELSFVVIKIAYRLFYGVIWNAAEASSSSNSCWSVDKLYRRGSTSKIVISSSTAQQISYKDGYRLSEHG